VFAADERGEASTVMRMVCAGIPVGIRWREQRSYLLPEGWRWDEDEGKVVFWGTIRGKPLQVDRLIHLPSYGDFQIDKVILITNGVLISDMFFTRRRHEQGKDIDGC
jgi:pre-rRNA-processing protein TSR1